ncbi:unnamed protein product [Paramecium sonneborni]|uniref:Ubiquitin-like protease family profile domain-containing protein n=1 Tax=Paramecium sonneborni TaxID=65129 RepID=A0A8S1RS25_9CILI|nr:unnamed protein product [Paramecium sonneborni]
MSESQTSGQTELPIQEQQYNQQIFLRNSKTSIVRSDEKNIQSFFLQELSQKGFQIINLDKSNSLFINENVIFYCKIETIEKFYDFLCFMNYCYNCEGKQYQIFYDQNQNPIYKIEEGKFYIFMSRKNIFAINSKGKEYSGKSNLIKQEGSFQNGKPEEIQQIDREFQQMASPYSEKIIIKDIETGRQLNSGIKKNIFQTQAVWCKFNQQLNEKDKQILSQRCWLNSSIIDAYVFFLNLENEKKYFNKNVKIRSQLQQILLIPTTFTSNLGTSYTLEKAQSLFQQELLQFQDLNWNLKLVYKCIGFPINRNKAHWYFLLFHLQDNIVELFDSLPSISFDDNLVKTLEQILQLGQCIRSIKKDFCLQRDGYSCGYYVCSFMQYISNLSDNPNLKYQYNEVEMRKELLNVIQEIY